MVAMTTPVGLPYGRALTVDDLDLVPADGRRYELVDGVLIVSPAQAWQHQAVQLSLSATLRAHSPGDLRVVTAPFEWRLSERTSVQPDILVATYEDLVAVSDGRYLASPPLLVVEILSPSTRRFDERVKLGLYADAGVPSYWLFEPDPQRPRLTIPTLSGRSYVQAASVTGNERWQADRPFAVTIRPAEIVADLTG